MHKVDFSIDGHNAIICWPSVNSTNGMMGEARGRESLEYNVHILWWLKGGKLL